jgi:5-(carboxyamino)imidazole ribonucleotide synthase
MKPIWANAICATYFCPKFSRLKQFYSHSFKLGVLGGGQLGRMLIQEAVNYDVNVAILDPSPNAPCAHLVQEFVVGDFADYDAVYNFGKDKDVLTIEIEHVNVEALRKLKSEGVAIYPDPEIIHIVQDKGLQKAFYRDHQIATADFVLINSKDEIAAHQDRLPFMQKLRSGGYDGRGVTAVRNEEELSQAFDAPSVLESFVDFEKEISVIIARNPSGEVKSYPVVELEFNSEANLVEYLFSPAIISSAVEEKAHSLAHRIVEELNFVGILAVEMFVTKTGDVLVNEIAPRPHNSGHHTIEANITSQYEQHLRAILNLPLGSTAIINPAVMVNLLGEPGYSGPVNYEGLQEALSWEGVHVHIYGKADTKPFRKMGHVTVVARSLEEATTLARRVKSTVRVIA